MVLRFNAEKANYQASAPELDLSTEAETRAEAIAQLETEIDAKIEAVATSGETLPPPNDTQSVESLTLELTPMLIRDLRLHAKLNKTSVGNLAVQMLAQGIGQLEGHRLAPRAEPDEPQRSEQPKQEGGKRRGGGGRRGQGGNQGGNQGRRRREGYHGDLDNSSNWLEYVRGLEKGGGRGRR